MDFAAIRNAAEAYKPAMVKFLRDMIAIPSESCEEKGVVMRIKQELEPGMVFALEPKIVLPGVGPVGIENSWTVTPEGVEKLTICNEEIIELQ